MSEYYKDMVQDIDVVKEESGFPSVVRHAARRRSAPSRPRRRLRRH